MSVHTLVIGAGPAGLATSRELTRAGVAHLVCERGDGVGHTWANLYDSLVLHTGKHLSALPGMPFPRSTPLFPTRREFLDYLQRYADAFHVPVRTRNEIVSVRRADGDWVVATTAGEALTARSLVLATGIVANPYLPPLPGRERFRGRVAHSVEYRRPDGCRGRRILVVGSGNSAGEIAAELAGAGAEVTIAVRSGARVVPRQLLGVPIQYVSVLLARLPRSAQQAAIRATARLSQRLHGPAVLPVPPAARCAGIPLIGFHLVDAIRAGAIRMERNVAELTADGARFESGSAQPFDEVIMATGFRAAVAPLGSLIDLDGCGFARRTGRVASADQERLFFVGHNYDGRGGLRNIHQDARLVARLIARSL